MLNHKYKKYADRIQELINQGNELRPFFTFKSASNAHLIPLRAWMISSSNIITLTFGERGPYVKHIDFSMTANSYEAILRNGIACLSAALADLQGGFVIGIEEIVAGEVFDSVLEEAKYLNSNAFKDSAAVLGRIVLEDALKRIATKGGIATTGKRASMINDELKTAQQYAVPVWRQVQAWLDIGNSAAHGKFTDYTGEQVTLMLEGISGFVATYLI